MESFYSLETILQQLEDLQCLAGQPSFKVFQGGDIFYLHLDSSLCLLFYSNKA